MNRIQKEIIEIIKKQFKIEENIVIEEPLTEYGVDSIKIVELVLIIEERYGFEFDSEKLTYKILRNVKTISEYVYQRLGEMDEK